MGNEQSVARDVDGGHVGRGGEKACTGGMGGSSGAGSEAHGNLDSYPWLTMILTNSPPLAISWRVKGVTSGSPSAGIVSEGPSGGQTRARTIGQGVTKSLARHGRVMLAIAPMAT